MKKKASRGTTPLSSESYAADPSSCYSPGAGWALGGEGGAWKRDVLAISLWPHPHLLPPLPPLPLPTPGISKPKMHREIRKKTKLFL